MRNVPVPVDAEEVEEWRERREDGTALRHFHGPAFYVHQEGLCDTTIHVGVRGLQESDGRITTRCVDITQVHGGDWKNAEGIDYLSAEDARDLAGMLYELADHVERFDSNGQL
jgi:hypothetical protein